MTKTEDIITKIKNSTRLLVLTGSGISLSSGISTFRGNSGLYSKKMFFNPQTFLTKQMFERSPTIMWYLLHHKYYKTYRHTLPSATHCLIAKLQKNIDTTIITQNVDRLHTIAGSYKTIELHGNMNVVYCSRCEYEARTQEFKHCVFAPKCPICGNNLRHNVVLFGENIKQHIKYSVEKAMIKQFDTMIVCGTSLSLSHVREITDYVKKCGTYIITIDPSPNDYLQSISNSIVQMKSDDFFQMFC